MPKVNTVDLFGLGSGRQTPKAYDRRKKIADALVAGGDEKPVSYNFAQGLAMVAPKIIGGIMGKMADDEEEKEEKDANDTMMKALQGLDPDSTDSGSTPSGYGGSQSSSESPAWSGSSDRPRSGGSGGSSRSYAANERRQRAVARLVEKGYSPHAAEGVADNLGDESAFNTKAVGDNGTAFGIAQWRGPRFANLKKFASSQGKDWQDFDTQVDFVDHEMRTGSDKGASIAFAKLQNAQDKDEAYNHFVTHYERPSAASLQKRMRQVRSGGTAQRIVDGEQTGYGADEPPAPQIDTRQFDAQINSGLLMMKNERTRDAGFKLYQQGITGKAAARQKMQEVGATRQYDDYKYRRDRNDKVSDEEARRAYELEKSDNEVLSLAPGSRLVRRGTGETVVDGPPKSENGGLSITYDEQGRPVVQMGGSGKPNTEMQAKYEQFYRRASGANELLDQTDESLATAEAYLKEYGPQVAQDYMLSDEYKMARQSAENFLVTIIRPDTGAAVTDTEFKIYGNIFLPRPNDPPALIAQKRDARRQALEALKAGMKPEQILKLAAPEKFDGTSILPKDMKRNKQGTPKVGDVWDGYRFKGGNPASESSWEEVR